MRRCIITNCDGRRGSTSHHKITLHRFPTDPNESGLWIVFVNKCNVNTFKFKNYQCKLKKTSRICSRHFNSDDFIEHGRFKTIKRGQVPSIVVGIGNARQSKENSAAQMASEIRKRTASVSLVNMSISKTLEDFSKRNQQFFGSMPKAKSCCSICGTNNISKARTTPGPDSDQVKRKIALFERFSAILKVSFLVDYEEYNDRCRSRGDIPDSFPACCTNCTRYLENLVEAQNQMQLAVQQFKLVRDWVMAVIVQSYIQQELLNPPKKLMPINLQDWSSFLNDLASPALLKDWKCKLEKHGLESLLITDKENITVEEYGAYSMTESSHDLEIEIESTPALDDVQKDPSDYELPELYSVDLDCQEIKLEDTGLEFHDFEDVGDDLFNLEPPQDTCIDNSESSMNLSRKLKTNAIANRNFRILTQKSKKTVTKLPNNNKLKTTLQKLSEFKIKLPRGRPRKPESSEPKPKLPKGKPKTAKLTQGQESSEKFECRICQRSFNNFGKRNLHEKNHKKLGGDTLLYNCSYCTRVMRYRGHFIKHMEKEHQDLDEVKLGQTLYFYQCDGKDCDNCFASKLLLETHIQTAHSSPNTPTSLKCTICDKVFAEEENLNSHRDNVHANETKVACLYCHLEFDSKAAAEFHQFIHEVNLAPGNAVYCEICGNVFRTIAKLASHRTKMHGEKEENVTEITINNETVQKQRRGKFSFFPCRACGITFASKRNLESHSYEHRTDHAGFTCNECNKIFKTPIKLQRHKTKVHRQVQCRFCQKRIWCVSVLRQHEFQYHYNEYMANKPFYCQICFKNFASQCELTDHEQVHRASICGICGLQCSHPRGLRIHERAHYIGRTESVLDKPQDDTANVNTNAPNALTDSIPNTCHVCKETLATKELLRTHFVTTHKMMVEETNQNDFVFLRPTQSSIHVKNRKSRISNSGSLPVLCPKKRRSKEQILADTHSIKHICATCGNVYATSATLKDHEFVHLPKGQHSGFDCHICGRNFVKRSLRFHHMFKKHPKFPKGPLKNHHNTSCLYCEKILVTKFQQKRHHVEVHADQHLRNQPFYCKVCFTTFATQPELDTHLAKAHHNCQFCGRPFTTKLKKTDHENTHTGNRPYHCQVCDKSFSSECYFTVHKRVHSRKWPYKCELCLNICGFNVQSHLKKHMKKRHPETLNENENPAEILPTQTQLELELE